MYKRGNAFYSDFWHEGYRHRKSWGQISRSRAKEKEGKWKNDIRNGKHIQRRRKIRFETFADKYLDNHVRQKKKPSTIRRYETSIKMLKPHFNGRAIAAIDPALVDSYIKKRKAAGKKPGTINRDIYTLRNMLRMAVKWGYLSFNPLATIEGLTEDNEKMWVLTDEQEEKLLAECDKRPQRKKYLKDLVLFGLNTGMRQGEIFNLKKNQVKIKDRYVLVTDTKTHKDRYVPLNDTAIAVLKRQLFASRSEYVFANRYGKKLTVLTNAFWTAVEEAGLYRIEKDLVDQDKKIRFRFHDLRHTFGSRLGMAAVDTKTIMEIMGHKTPRMAMRYQHPAADHKLAAVKVLEKSPPKITTGNIVESGKE